MLLVGILALSVIGSLINEPTTVVAQSQVATSEYNTEIRPILSRACFNCHGSNERARQADLRLDTDTFLETHVVPGDADASTLFQRLTTDEAIGRMPPVSTGLSLSDAEIETVRRWIDDGAVWGAAVAMAVDVAERTVDFEREVRPILSQRCFACHGPDEQGRQRGLRLDIEDGIHGDREGFGGAAVIPGDAAGSLLYQRIIETNAALRMPRGGEALTESEAETIRLWIDQGAEWQSHWAFIPPERSPLPPVTDVDWVRNPIDQFVLAQLEAGGLTPSEEADRITLLRRVTLDLTGLPPTEGEITAFLNDDAPDAYEQAVDRLLGSQRYGERMAVEWLDAARYADTNGYQTDGERSMWRWRDWVIDAYNNNMPFDQFTIEQIAGDMLPNPTRDQRIATAFNRNHSQNGEGGIVEEEFLVEYAVDRVQTTSTVWLGLTLGCARCHDHKFDPLSQKEFYEFYAHFNNVPERGKAFKYVNSPPLITAPTTDQEAQLAALDDKLHEAREAFAAMASDSQTAQAEWEASLAASLPIDWSLTDQLVAHHPFDGNIAGLVQPAEPVTAVLEEGSPRFVEGRVGAAASFDGQRFVNAGNHPNVGYDDKWSVAAWIYPTATNGVIVSRANGGDQGEVGWGLYLEDGKVRLNLSTRILDDGVSAETVDEIELNQWQHVVATYDGSKTPEGMRVYIDGSSKELTGLLDLVGNRLPQRYPLRIGASGSEKPRFQGHIDDVRIYTKVLTAEQAAVVATVETISEIVAMAPGDRTAAQRDKLYLCFLDQYAPQAIQTAWRDVVALERARDALWESFPTVMVMEEMEPRRPTFRLDRGAYDNPAEPVSPGVPAVLPPLPQDGPANRLALARWLVDPQHPLTARVTVNRFWQMYFGTGIVKTSENFGTQGEFPSHPALLDWLATTFIDSGWDVKAIQRAIVTSATYRQASPVTAGEFEADPENRRLARGPRLRLQPQMIRDQALAVSGLLVEKVGGPSVKPYQPEGLWADMVEGGYGDYVEAEGDDLYRRSLYTFWKRTLGPPTMMTFDASTRETCIVRTGRTNTPLQALNLMNDVTYIEAARRLAESMITSGGTTPEERLAYGYRAATAHRPQPGAQAVLLDGFEQNLAHYQNNRQAALDLISMGESPRNETLDVAELASYTMTASLILNLDGTITKE